MSHAPRPILRASATARLAICSQAPGLRAHASGIPFNDPSGVRLRAWMGVTPEEFYNEQTLAILPMGFCFPGYDVNGGDLPPRAECAPLWRKRLMAELPNLEMLVLIGAHAIRWHLPDHAGRSMTATVADGVSIFSQSRGRDVALLPLPHPSWRNNGWLKTNPWFETDIIPVLRRSVDLYLR